MKAKVVVVFFLLLAGARAGAQAQDPHEQAKRHFANGEQLFRAGEYRAAIFEFQAADTLVASPILSYNIGLCQEKLGDDAAAVQSFKKYLQGRPDAPNRAAVEVRITSLEEKIARAAKPTEIYSQLDEPTPATPGTVDTGSDPTPTPPAVSGDLFAARLPSHPAAGGGVAAAAGTAPAVPAGGPAEQAPAPAPAPEEPQKKSKPVYKEWWFWVVVGVSAVILIDIARGGDENNPEYDPANGATLFRF